MDSNKPYIVGQPMQFIYWFPVILIRCKCDMEGLKLLIIRGLDIPVECPGCGRNAKVSGFDESNLPIILCTAPTKPTGLIQ